MNDQRVSLKVALVTHMDGQTTLKVTVYDQDGDIFRQARCYTQVVSFEIKDGELCVKVNGKDDIMIKSWFRVACSRE